MGYNRPVQRPKPDSSTDYLDPYRRAIARHGEGFRSLLWSSPHTQAARFDVLARAIPLAGLTLLDVGCGRADLWDHLQIRHNLPARYLGIEAMPELVVAARRTGQTIIEADFLAQPEAMRVDADVIYFSGSLNTIDDRGFCDAIENAHAATRRTLVFNFLCSSALAGGTHLYQRAADDVIELLRELTGTEPTLFTDYLDGDATLVVHKRDTPATTSPTAAVTGCAPLPTMRR